VGGIDLKRIDFDVTHTHGQGFNQDNEFIGGPNLGTFVGFNATQQKPLESMAQTKRLAESTF
jgi:hypothetical protein